MRKPRIITFMGIDIPVMWTKFEREEPRTCRKDTYGVVFPPEDTDYGFSIFINTRYKDEQQRATLLSELWHVVAMRMDINRYSHINMHIVMDHIYEIINTNKWLRLYLWPTNSKK